MVESEFSVPCILMTYPSFNCCCFHPARKRPGFVFSQCEDSRGWMGRIYPFLCAQEWDIDHQNCKFQGCTRGGWSNDCSLTSTHRQPTNQEVDVGNSLFTVQIGSFHRVIFSSLIDCQKSSDQKPRTHFSLPTRAHPFSYM